MLQTLIAMTKSINRTRRLVTGIQVERVRRVTSAQCVEVAVRRKLLYWVSQEERSIFWEVIVAVILSKKTLYEHVSYSERFPR